MLPVVHVQKNFYRDIHIECLLKTEETATWVKSCMPVGIDDIEEVKPAIFNDFHHNNAFGLIKTRIGFSKRKTHNKILNIFMQWNIRNELGCTSRSASNQNHTPAFQTSALQRMINKIYGFGWILWIIKVDNILFLYYNCFCVQELQIKIIHERLLKPKFPKSFEICIPSPLSLLQDKEKTTNTATIF